MTDADIKVADRIQAVVAKYFGVTVRRLRGPSRERVAVRARHVAMYLCRKHTKFSLPDIGDWFGHRSHATVLHAVDKIDTEIEDGKGAQVADIEGRAGLRKAEA